MEFWIAVDGESYGPYEPGQIQEMVAGAQLAPEAEIWFPDRQQWVPAAYLVGFVPAPQLAAVGAASAPAGAPAPTYPTEVPAAAAVLPPTADPAPQWAPATDASQAWAYPGAGESPPTEVEPARRSTNLFAVAALVVGVLALGVSWLPLFNLVAIGAAVVGLVLVLLALVQTRKGAGGKAMAIAALVMCLIAAVVSVLVSTVFVQAVDEAATDLATAVQEQPAESLLVTLGPPRWDGATTTVRARVSNSGAQAVSGGTFTVQAIARNGTVVDETTGSLPALAVGQTTAVQVVFVKRIPPGATMSVTGVNAVR